jgi:DNA repair photolyase
VKIGETTCRGIMNKSGIEGVDYAINPYIGCGHGCVYCYARFMTRWYHQGESWGSFVDVKKNAAECLRREAPRKPVGTVLFSSVTDPYQPVERKFKATRSLLEILKDHSFPVEILTKSSLVQRDLDVISEIDEVEIGLTVTFWNDETRRVFEPGASPTQERIETLEWFSDAGIPTYAFLGPLIPYLSEEDMDMLLNSLADKVNRVLVDRLNIKAGNWGRIRETLERHYPDQLSAIQEASREPSSYYDSLRGKMKLEIGRRAIPADILF